MPDQKKTKTFEVKPSKLGAVIAYSDQYDVNLLEAIPRALARGEGAGPAKFYGFDIWNAYELSWLNLNGIPQVAVGEFRIASNSECIVESKSLKYYLNSFNQTQFSSIEQVQQTIQRDISALVSGEVGIELHSLSFLQAGPERFALSGGMAPLKIPGRCVDQIQCNVSEYQPDAAILALDGDVGANGSRDVIEEQLYSNLLKSNCPVTGQPDWATLWVHYRGGKISPTSFLQYVVSFRQYEGFHESCVERIYSDLIARFDFEFLCVYARYTRRGGLDINPLRVSEPLKEMKAPFGRLLRQ